jgi:16S rRNA (guanine527-N7)-methyltransferase
MQTLADAARTFEIELAPTQLELFETYLHELTDWNTRINLTTIIERDQVIVKHFLDSLTVLRAFPSDTMTVLDVGSGAGFPGVPISIARPNLRVTLLETTGKKVEFLKHLIATLKLEHTTAIHARAEDLGHDATHRGRYGVVVARAVANLPVLAEYTLPFVRVGGVFIAQKGVEVQDEVKGAERAIKLLGGQVREITPVQLPGLEPRHLIVVEKISKTPDTYPRRAGMPERKPL